MKRNDYFLVVSFPIAIGIAFAAKLLGSGAATTFWLYAMAACAVAIVALSVRLYVQSKRLRRQLVPQRA